ncbi:MAG: DUF881 domain-containing protein [Alicyclobacillaceae bacterium]|jgi:uncharacterized protein YlxW (UPF0749 family)|uniref:DUF881 domain-containing protein n=1 Tax=Alicyclobacillus sp. SP_1 TaxID=2942475 RepID=UPI002158325F|nr:DUF881 domain-containing protein [Alicyclobacillus sp. SP_1]MCY0886967.1 DUF881 domain-containing protein [Alicyclobacillaceae bacterium]MCY0897197.1 DUF881 domain-containing protein [Alicyclobacillaceae bacterium]
MKRGTMWTWTGVAAVFGFLLTVQWSQHPSSHASDDNFVNVRTQLTEQAQEHRILAAEISKQAALLAEYHAASGSKASMRQALREDAETVAEEAGTAPFRGPGITATIEDDPYLPFVPQFAGQFYKESDQWIQLIVNYLFSNGAAAISINGQRLVTTSSIRLVVGLDGLGGLQINTHPIAMPYVITAIGNIGDMKAALTVFQIKNYLAAMGENFVVKTYSGKDGLTVPAYTGPLPGTWAKEVTNP